MIIKDEKVKLIRIELFNSNIISYLDYLKM